MLRQSFMSQQRNSIATEKTLSRQSFLSQKRKLCLDRVLCRDRENSVAIEKLCHDKNAGKKPKNAENGYFSLFASPLHPRTINTRLFLCF